MAFPFSHRGRRATCWLTAGNKKPWVRITRSTHGHALSGDWSGGGQAPRVDGGDPETGRTTAAPPRPKAPPSRRKPPRKRRGSRRRVQVRLIALSSYPRAATPRRPLDAPSQRGWHRHQCPGPPRQLPRLYSTTPRSAIGPDHSNRHALNQRTGSPGPGGKSALRPQKPPASLGVLTAGRSTNAPASAATTPSRSRSRSRPSGDSLPMGVSATKR